MVAWDDFQYELQRKRSRRLFMPASGLRNLPITSIHTTKASVLVPIAGTATPAPAVSDQVNVSYLQRPEKEIFFSNISQQSLKSQIGLESHMPCLPLLNTMSLNVYYKAMITYTKTRSFFVSVWF